MNIVYVPGATVLPLIDERHLGLELGRDSWRRRARPAHRGSPLCRSSSPGPAEHVAAALDRPAVGDLDPLAALVDRLGAPSVSYLPPISVAAVPAGLAGRPPCATTSAVMASDRRCGRDQSCAVMLSGPPVRSAACPPASTTMRRSERPIERDDRHAAADQRAAGSPAIDRLHARRDYRRPLPPCRACSAAAAWAKCIAPTTSRSISRSR